MLLSMKKKITSLTKPSRTFPARCFRILYICFLTSLPVCLSAQEQDVAKPQIIADLAKTDKGGQVELLGQAAQAENLLKMQIANNKLQEGIPGYRISIFSQSGQTARQKADEVRMAFMRSYPDIEAYKEFNTPNYQIYVGDFRTKTEALRLYKQISKTYPRAFIVSETINIPK